MPWLDEIDLRDARRLRRSLQDAPSAAAVRELVVDALGRLVGADVASWDEIELRTGEVRHVAFPPDAEPPGAFAALVRSAGDHPLLAAHGRGRRRALRLSEAGGASGELHAELLRPSAADYQVSVGLRTGQGRAVAVGLGRRDRDFSVRDADLLDAVQPAVEGALRRTQARERLLRALATDPPPGTAVVLLDRWGEIEHSSLEAERWLAEHFGASEHPGWLPAPVAGWLALPPRPPLVSVSADRRLTVTLLPGDPHALLLEHEVRGFSGATLARLGLTSREREVLEAARALADESTIADELFLSVRAVRSRLERAEAKLGARTGPEAVAEALRAEL